MGGADLLREPPRRLGCTTTWTVDLLGEKLLEIAQEQRRLRNVPEQMGVLLQQLQELPLAERTGPQKLSSSFLEPPEELVPRSIVGSRLASRRQSRCSSEVGRSLSTLSDGLVSHCGGACGGACGGGAGVVSSAGSDALSGILPSAIPVIGSPAPQASGAAGGSLGATPRSTWTVHGAGTSTEAGVEVEDTGGRSRRNSILSRHSSHGSWRSALSSGGSHHRQLKPPRRPSSASGYSSHFSFLHQFAQYFSMDTNEVRLNEVIDEDAPPAPMFMHPAGWMRMGWDIMMLLIVILTAVMVPLTLAYHNRRVGDLEGDAWLMTALDVSWFFSIIANFMTAAVDGDELVYDPYAIAAQYGKSFLLVDLTSMWPALLSSPFELPEVPCILYALKLVRLSRLDPLMTKLQVSCDLPKLVQFKRGLEILLLLHTLSCGWRLVQRFDGTDEGHRREPMASGYIRDLYWTSMTVTTVGYGDIVPQGAIGRAYAVFVMMVGTIFHGTVVSLITHYTAGIFVDSASVRVAEIRGFLIRHKVCRELRGYIEDNLRRRIRIDEQGMNQELLAKLSPSLQRELSLALLKDVILNFPLFRQAPRGFIAEIARAHAILQCLPGDVIVEYGEVLKDLVFVMQGRLIASSHPMMKNTAFASKHFGRAGFLGLYRDIEAGAWFGEESLFRVLDYHSSPEGGPLRPELLSEDGDRPLSEGVRGGSRDHSRAEDTEDQVSCAHSFRSVYRGTRRGRKASWDEQVQQGAIFAFQHSELAMIPGSEYWRICWDFPQMLERQRKVCDALWSGRLNLDVFTYSSGKT